MATTSGSRLGRTIVLVGVTAVAMLAFAVLADELWHQLDPAMPAMRFTRVLGVPFQTAGFALVDALRADSTLVVLTSVLLIGTGIAWLRRFVARRASAQRSRR